MFFRRSSPVWAAVLLAFAVAFAEFGWLHADATFADPDSFYHARIAVRLAQYGLVTDFPWLAQTVLGDAYIDHHFLYHVLLVPFVTWLPPLAGLKLATVLFAATAVAAFHWLLRRLEVGGAWRYTGVLLVSNPLLFRIGLAKAQALSLTALLVLVWLVLQRRALAAAALSAVYVWLYGGWPLAGVVAAAYVSAGVPAVLGQTAGGRWRLDGGRLRVKLKADAALLGAVGGGLAAGLVLSPYFPTNLVFYWHQIVEVAVVNYRNVIGVGGEWYAYPLVELLAATSVAATVGLAAAMLWVLAANPQGLRPWQLAVLTVAGWAAVGTVLTMMAQVAPLPAGVAWLAARVFPGSVARYLAVVLAAVALLTLRDHSARVRTLYLLAAAFLLLTLRSRRNVEYFIPFLILFAAAVFSRLGRAADLRRFTREFWAYARASPIVLAGLLTPLLLFPVIIVRDLAAVRSANAQGQPFDRYGPALRWLREHAPAGATVFHSDWDEFPQLFYHDDRHAYIAGLDPTFLYKQDPVKYDLWLRTTTAKIAPADLHRAIRVDFGAGYVVVTLARHAAFDTLVASAPQAFVPIYRDTEVSIYRVSDYPVRGNPNDE